MNRISIIGRFVKNPELKDNNGTKVVEVSLAENDGKVTTFFDVTFFNKNAENVCKYCHKGDSIYVDGKVSINNWKDNQGVAHSKIKVNVMNLTFIGSRNASEEQPTDFRDEANKVADTLAPNFNLSANDLPF